MPIIFSFYSQGTANRLIAGVPAAARLARAWHLIGEETGRTGPLRIQLRDGGSLAAHTFDEIQRLADRTVVELEASARQGDTVLDGENNLDSASLAASLSGSLQKPPTVPLLTRRLVHRRLIDAEIRIIKATGKIGDGIVSRWLNRPISQFLSRRLLKLAWVRPGHATIFTAIVAMAMFACLVLGGHTGLIAGAVLFQCASVVDGVDGEIARATWRSSSRGAMLDSAIDAATNLGFIAGVIINRLQAGADSEALVGVIGFAALLVGLTLLGASAKARGEPLNFDGAKKIVDTSRSAVLRILRYLTMRDFYCLFLCVMILSGQAFAALILFTAAASIWSVFIIVFISRTHFFREEPAR
jgi:1L-myo-inositol 1-phosphate cytidylyltransferase / CDP-L-myo-inositol myo-inositolphosphotransferase